DWQMLQQMSDLKELARQPRLLDLIVTSLVSLEAGINFIMIHIYKIYINLWSEHAAREPGRLLTRDLTLALMRELAWQLWHRAAHVFHARELTALVREHVSSYMVGYDDAEIGDLVRELQTVSFLRRSGAAGYFTFMHQSLLEYFLACHVLHHFPDDDSM